MKKNRRIGCTTKQEERIDFGGQLLNKTQDSMSVVEFYMMERLGRNLGNNTATTRTITRSANRTASVALSISVASTRFTCPPSRGTTFITFFVHGSILPLLLLQSFFVRRQMMCRVFRFSCNHRLGLFCRSLVFVLFPQDDDSGFSSSRGVLIVLTHYL
jgi:hypothetical protein